MNQVVAPVMTSTARLWRGTRSRNKALASGCLALIAIVGTAYAQPAGPRTAGRAIAVDPQGAVYFGGADSASLVKLDFSGGSTSGTQLWRTTLSADPNAEILALAQAPDGSLYAAGSLTKGGFFAHVKPTGETIFSQALSAAVRALAVGPSGAVYLGGDGFLRELDSDLKTFSELDPQGSVTGLAVDQTGAAYAAIATTSGRAQVSKLSPQGDRWLWRLDLGPGAPAATALDALGSIYVTGTTSSLDFLTNQPVQGWLNGPSDAFAAKISATGELVWSTYLGGRGADAGTSLAFDLENHLVVGGYSSSSDFPGADAAFPWSGGEDGFVAWLDPNSGSVLRSIYVGTAGQDRISAIGVDGRNRVHFGGLNVRDSAAGTQALQFSAQKAAALQSAASAVCQANPYVTVGSDSLTSPAVGSLRWALNIACDGGQVNFNPAVTVVTLAGEIQLNKNISIIGNAGTNDSTVILNPHSHYGDVLFGSKVVAQPHSYYYRIFFVGSPTFSGHVYLNSLHLYNGIVKGQPGYGGGGSAGMGGAIFQDGGDLTLWKVIVDGNEAQGAYALTNSAGGSNGGAGFGGYDPYFSYPTGTRLPDGLQPVPGQGGYGAELGGSGGLPGQSANTADGSLGNVGGGPGYSSANAYDGSGGGAGGGSNWSSTADNVFAGDGGAGGFGAGGGPGGQGGQAIVLAFNFGASIAYTGTYGGNGGNGGHGGFGGGSGAGGGGGGSSFSGAKFIYVNFPGSSGGLSGFSGFGGGQGTAGQNGQDGQACITCVSAGHPENSIGNYGYGGYGGGGAGFGGGIFVLRGSLNLFNVSFLNNKAVGGGDSVSDYSDTPGCTVGATHCGEGRGGAIFAYQGLGATVYAEQVTYSGSVAPNAGIDTNSGLDYYGNVIQSGQGTQKRCPGADTADICGVVLPGNGPVLAIESPTGKVALSGRADVVGWALNDVYAPTTCVPNCVSHHEGILSINAFVDGQAVAQYPQDPTYQVPLLTFLLERPDICAVTGYSGYNGRPDCPNVGFTFSIDTTKLQNLDVATHTLTVVASDSYNSKTAYVTFVVYNEPIAGSLTPAPGSTPQSAVARTSFANLLSVTAKDANGNGVAGVRVTFLSTHNPVQFGYANIPSSVITDSFGVAAVRAVASVGGGSYTVSASAQGATTVLFFLTNTGGNPVAITANAGSTPQSAGIGQAFGTPPSVTVTGQYLYAFPSTSVTFTAPASGASGTFANGTNTVVVATNSLGIATGAQFRANSTAGSYSITASVDASFGVAPISLSMTNTSGAPAILTATGAASRTAPINTALGSPFAVTLLDTGNNPVAGQGVTFTATGKSANGLFPNGKNSIVVQTDSSGNASTSFTANSTAGGPYAVTASLPGVPGVSFAVTNLPGAAAAMTLNSQSSPQSTLTNTGFPVPLMVTVSDAFGNLVSSVNVAFTAPATGATATLSAPSAVTNASGVASVTATANSTAGGPYNVTASVTGVTSVTFALTNTALVPNVVGLTQAAATTAITGAGLMVGTVTQAASSTVATGLVISESPVAATQVSLGSSVNLVISTGPAQVAVPNVVGLTQAAATTGITGAGLVVGTVTQAASSTVATGSVISESPTAGTVVNLGSSVSLVVSSGPAAMTVGTNPSPNSFTVDGVAYTTTQTFYWTPGSPHTLACTDSPATGSQCTGWSDGSPISHNITAPATPTSYMANFMANAGVVDTMVAQVSLSGSTASPGCAAGSRDFTLTVQLQNNRGVTINNPTASLLTLTQGNTLVSQSWPSSIAPGAMATGTFHITLANCNTFQLYFDLIGQ